MSWTTFFQILILIVIGVPVLAITAAFIKAAFFKDR